MGAIDYQSVRDYSLFAYYKGDYYKGECNCPYDVILQEHKTDDRRRFPMGYSLPPTIIWALEKAGYFWMHERRFMVYCRERPTVEDWSAFFQRRGQWPCGAHLPARFAELAARRDADPRLFERGLFDLWFEWHMKYLTGKYSDAESKARYQETLEDYRCARFITGMVG